MRVEHTGSSRVGHGVETSGSCDSGSPWLRQQHGPRPRAPVPGLCPLPGTVVTYTPGLLQDLFSILHTVFFCLLKFLSVFRKRVFSTYLSCRLPTRSPASDQVKSHLILIRFHLGHLTWELAACSAPQSVCFMCVCVVQPSGEPPASACTRRWHLT